MENPLISIIIPNFNRAHLIGSTLDSIRSQIYKNWECIIIDDGSSDYSQEILEWYCTLDTRFRFYTRPIKRPKGANACRNFGFEVSRGEFIQWFDSDDLMMPEFLSKKLEVLLKQEVDFVISKTEGFKDPNPHSTITRYEKYYRFNDYKISNYNYVTQKINWLTYDFMGKRKVLENIKFNEKLPSGQEYNFFCKLTLFTVNCTVIDSFLTKRRIHPDSIRGKLNQNKHLDLKNKGIIDFENWKEIKDISKEGNSNSVDYLFSTSLRNTLNIDIPFETRSLLILTKELKKKTDFFTVFLYLSYQLTSRTIRKGYFLRKKFLVQWNQV